jgi:hypothetical protein
MVIRQHVGRSKRMSDMDEREKIPEHVKEELRAKVGYGCPVCRSPFLTWHHFDPPYNVRPHNDPKGMIALCNEHHGEADNDNWPPERLHALKKTPRSVEEVKGSYPSWEHENFLVRFGGNYTGGSEVILAIEGRPLVRLRRNVAGLLALSFDLWDADGKLLLRMVDNSLELYPKDVHDFIATAKKREVMLWIGDRDIGLDLSFERITMEELDKLLVDDFMRIKKKSDSLLDKALERIGNRLGQVWQESDSSQRAVPSWIDRVPEGIREQVREGFLTGDMTGPWVKKWARTNCAQSDGKIPFLNFKNLSFFFSGNRLRVRHGVTSEGLEIGYSAALDNAVGAFNLPAPRG